MINLLPWREQARRKAMHQFCIILLLGCLFSLLGLGVTHYFLAKNIRQAEQKNILVQQALKKISTQLQTIKQLQESTNATEQRIDFAQQIQKQNGQLREQLQKIPAIIPEGVFLTHIQRTTQDTLLVGETDTYSLINEFMRELQKADPMTHIVLKGMDKNQQHEKFSLLLTANQI